jgi:hypothetical protein
MKHHCISVYPSVALVKVIGAKVVAKVEVIEKFKGTLIVMELADHMKLLPYVLRNQKLLTVLPVVPITNELSRSCLQVMGGPFSVCAEQATKKC